MHVLSHQRWTHRIGRLALSVLTIFLATGCWEETTEAPAAPVPKVEVSKATTETVPLYLALTGRTVSPNTVDIRARVDGHVEERPFVEGTDVKAGDTLFVLDQRPYQTELARLEGERDKSQASLDFANKEVDRFAVITADGDVSQEKLDEKTATAAEAQGDLNSNQGAVDAARVNLDYTTVTAPIDGRIGQVYQDVGNVVTANDTVLVEIVQMDPLHVYVSPSEEQFLDLEKHRATNPDLDVAISLIDGTTHPHKGTLDFTNPGIDPATGTISVRAVFPNPDKTLRPGQYATVQIQLAEEQGQITVPVEAIGQDQAGFYAFVVGKDNTTELRRVTVGRVYENRRLIQTGLKEGETVITKGQQRVKSGMTVDVVEPKAKSTAEKTGG